MPEGIAGGNAKAIGYTEMRDGEGNLLVAFNSEDAEDYWGNRYQAARIKYCMQHRRMKIPNYLRTGKKPLWLRITGLEREAKRLEKLLQEVET